MDKLPWRNWLARSAVNRKVGGSSPPGSDIFFSFNFNLFFFIFYVSKTTTRKFANLDF